MEQKNCDRSTSSTNNQQPLAEQNILLEREKAAQERATQLAEHNRVLEQRDREVQRSNRILAATAEASNVLLTGEDFEKAVNQALQIIGESIDTDRVGVMEHCDNPSGQSLGYVQALYEWDSVHAISQINHPEVARVSYEGIEEWYDRGCQGEWSGGVIDELPEPFRSSMAKIGVKATYSIPIIVESKYWGIIGIDDCREETRRSEAELSILKTAATCIGGAIERERTRRAKEEAERNILLEREKAVQERARQLEEYNRILEKRDRILTATAEASNVLLTGENFDKAVNQALQIIGESLDTDRVTVIENWSNPSKPLVPHWKILYEWNSPDIISQISHPELAQGSYEGIEEWYELQKKGQSISCRLEEMPEPFRSGQAQIGVKILHAVPIFIESKHWGLAGFDDCREETHRSEAELSILKTAAACIGGAIEQERTRRAKEEAERNILLEREKAATERAKLLQAVATVANSLLRSPDYRTVLPEVLQILGEAAKSDRCSLVQNVTDPNTGKAAVKICAEWCREGIIASIESTPELETALLWEHFPQFQDKLTQGELSTFLVDDLLEPAHSILQAQGNLSMTLVPIMVQGEFYGVFGFDYCQESRLFDEADTAIFAIAVDSIVAAIAREQKDEALRASEKRYRELFEASNDGIHFVEFEPPIPLNLPIEEQIDRIYNSSRFTDGNPAWERYCGLSRSEMIGQPLTVVHSPDSEGHRSLLRRLIDNGWQITNAESEDIDANGKKRYWLSHLFTTVENGYVVRGWGVVNNITPLKEAQQNLLEVERQRAAQLEESNQILSLRDRWLEATANAANCLLATPDLDEGINAALKMLGESLDCDRVAVMQHIEDSTSESLGFVRGLYEWNSPYASRQIVQPEWVEVSWEGIEDWLIREKAGDWVGGIVTELPEPFRSKMIELDVQSLYNVPIFVNDIYWGALGIDFCREPKRLTPVEIAVFKTAASCIGSAIYRQQIQQQREQAKKTIILEREKAAQEKAAELTKVNQVLAQSLNKLFDTADLDSFLGQVLLEITHQVGAVCGHIFLYDADNHTLQQRLSVRHGIVYQGAVEHDCKLFHSPQPADLSPIFSYLCQTREISLLSTNYDADSTLWWPETLEWHWRMGHQEAAAIALMIGDKPLGLLGLAFTEKTALQPEELELIHALTNQASLAIQLTKLAEDAKQTAILQEREKAAQEKAAELTKVNQVLAQSLNKLTDTADLDSFLGQVLLEITRQVGAACGHVFLYDAHNQTLQQRLSVRNGITYQEPAEHDCELFHSPFPADVTSAFQPMLETGAFQHMLETGEIILISTLDTSALLRTGTPEWHRNMGHQEAAAIALMIGDKPLGLLGLAFTEKTALQPKELELIHALTNQASLAIQLTKLAEDAKQTAILQEREKAAQEKAAELTKVNQVLAQSLNKLTDTADLDSFLGQVLLEITRQVGAACGHIFLYDAHNQTLQQRLSVRNGIIYQEPAEHDCQLFHSPFPADITPGFSYMCQTREISLLSTNYDADSTLWWPETLEWHWRMGHQEAAAIALMIGDIPLGLLGLAFTEKTALKPEELELIYALTNQASLAIQLTNLAEQAQKSALTDERNRMAREIHDTLAQAFTGISLQLEAARNSLFTQPEAAQERLLRAKILAKEGINEARRSVRALRPEALESGDLITALHQLVDKMISGTDIKAEISIEGEPRSLNPEVEIGLFRIAQEAITNTLRYAQASEIGIQLIYETDIFHLQIKDNGIGFNPQLLQNEGFGLIGMRERCDRLNGNLVINSASHRGTEIIVTV